MNLPGLYDRIAAIVPQVPGWCTLEKACTMASLIVGLRPQLVVEIGIYGGSSFIPQAMAVKEVGCGIILGIEPWSNDVAVAAQTENESRAWWQDQQMAAIRDGFYQRIRELRLDTIVQIQEKPSRQVEVPMKIGLLHVDGAHNDEAVTDVTRFCPQVEMGGFVVMDDSKWVGGGVARAEQRLVQMGYKFLYPLGTGAVYQRVR